MFTSLHPGSGLWQLVSTVQHKIFPFNLHYISFTVLSVSKRPFVLVWKSKHKLRPKSSISVFHLSNNSGIMILKYTTKTSHFLYFQLCLILMSHVLQEISRKISITKMLVLKESIQQYFLKPQTMSCFHKFVGCVVMFRLVQRARQPEIVGLNKHLMPKQRSSPQ